MQQPGSREEPTSAGTAPQGRDEVRASQLLRELFPDGVALYELHGPGDPAALLPEERQCLERASLKRAHEFAAGRICARAAMAQFGVEDYPLGMAEDRSPLWPRQLCGSISHTYGYCAAAVADRTRFKAVGLDVERMDGMSPEVWRTICAPAEAEWLERLPGEERTRVAALIFSAKEAFYKCQYAVTRQWLEFDDITLDFTGWELGAGSFAVRPLGISRLLQHQALPWLGRFRFRGGLVLSGIAFTAD